MKKNLMYTLLFVLLTTTSFAQFTSPYTLHGKVLNHDNGDPLVGASIWVKGTSIKTLTGLDGQFHLGIPDSCASITINHPGFTMEELNQVCSNGQALSVRMKIAEPLNDVLIAMPEIQKETGATEYAIAEEVASGNRSRRRPQKLMAYDAISAPKRLMQGRSNSIQNYPAYPQEGVIIHNTEDYDHIKENRFFEVKNEPLSTFSIDVDAASYSNMRRFINNGSLPPKDAVRIEEMVNYFNYDYPAPKSEHPFEVITELSDCPWNTDHQLLHIGLQGKKIPTENLPASNMVFLIDVSGSMSAANKLPLLKSSFKLLTDQMRPQDKVAIVVYASASGVVLPPTPGTQKDKIIAALDKLSAGGSTAGGAGIKLAYKLAKENFVEGGNNRVILATDGDFNVGQSSDGELVNMIEKERESGVFLTVLGFGMGNYKDNKMQKLANHGNGNHAYIDNIDEARKVLVSEFGGTMFTIAKDVKLQLEFNPAYVAGYRLIGYENRLLNNEDFNDDKKDAGELGSGHTVTALYEIIPKGVKSDFLKKVDDLKYQEGKAALTGALNNELMTVKLRYKKPDGNTSILLDHIQKAKTKDLKKSSDNFRWSAAVAELGLLLRKSEFKQNANYDQVLSLAKGAKGEDDEGYRSEFIRMVRSVRDMVEPITAGKK